MATVCGALCTPLTGDWGHELTFHSQSLTEYENWQRIWSINSTIGAVEACCQSGFFLGGGEGAVTDHPLRHVVHQVHV